ncbi:hypothetical protein Bhyg_03704 [Pseudolycoriella hygida]|uniref:Uncharacterized protein n=1 Tax=Pseudolycoriella hygida TaxID=35572 RepID=A0A9Q0S7R2_9DIPT|nr:hypothetical protein Bhyg_03704 [Pseudolycoriella hygida]
MVFSMLNLRDINENVAPTDECDHKTENSLSIKSKALKMLWQLIVVSCWIAEFRSFQLDQRHRSTMRSISSRLLQCPTPICDSRAMEKAYKKINVEGDKIVGLKNFYAYIKIDNFKKKSIVENAMQNFKPFSSRLLRRQKFLCDWFSKALTSELKISISLVKKRRSQEVTVLHHETQALRRRWNQQNLERLVLPLRSLHYDLFDSSRIHGRHQQLYPREASGGTESTSKVSFSLLFRSSIRNLVGSVSPAAKAVFQSNEIKRLENCKTLLIQNFKRLPYKNFTCCLWTWISPMNNCEAT